MCILVAGTHFSNFPHLVPTMLKQSLYLLVGGWKSLQNGPFQEERFKYTKNPKSWDMAQSEHSQKPTDDQSHTYVLSFRSVIPKY